MATLKGYAIKRKNSAIILEKKQAQTVVQSLDHAIDIIERQLEHNALCAKLISELEKKGY